MEEKIRLFCDRVEEDIAVLLSDNGTVYEIPAETLPGGRHAEGKSYLCTVKDGTVTAAEAAETPGAGENKKRLSSLFGKNKSRKNSQSNL